MDNAKLNDSIEMPLQSSEDAPNQMLSGGLQLYLDHFIALFVGDWPVQFYIRRLVCSDVPSVVPLTGPLHISLNARELLITYFLICTYSY